jgi:hypothetical protein
MELYLTPFTLSHLHTHAMSNSSCRILCSLEATHEAPTPTSICRDHTMSHALLSTVDRETLVLGRENVVSRTTWWTLLDIDNGACLEGKYCTNHISGLWGETWWSTRVPCDLFITKPDAMHHLSTIGGGLYALIASLWWRTRWMMREGSCTIAYWVGLGACMQTAMPVCHSDILVL